jgi:hypothetical protein
VRLLLLTLLAILSQPGHYPAPVRAMGYCVDVTSTACAVRDYWPRFDRLTSAGQDAYWLESTDRPPLVCFVTRQVYNLTVVGQPTDCLWREARP